MIIYMARNTVNGKAYIGQTIRSLRERKTEHFAESKRTSNKTFVRALAKYGPHAFEWIVLANAGSLDELNKLEMHYISTHNTIRPRGYNITSGGAGSRNRQISEETREKMSKSHVGQLLSDEIKKKISIAKTNPSEETRRKMSAAWTTERHQAHVVVMAKRRGKSRKRELSDQARKNISVAKKKWWDARKVLLGEEARIASLNPIAKQRAPLQVAILKDGTND